MRILHLEASPGWGGQEIRILRESEGMRDRGHEVVLGVMHGGGLVAHAKNSGFTVYELNFRRLAWIGTLFWLLWIIQSHKIDIVNTHSSLDGWIGGIAARIMGRKVVRTRHLSTPIRAGLNSKLLYGFLADFVVTTCAPIIPMICQQSGKKKEACRCIATGVDPKRIVVNEQLDWGAGFWVGTACFMRSWKGIGDLLKAADLLRDVPNLKWVIIGGGHQETYIQMSKEMKLDGVVHFTGHLKDPFPAMARLDVFMLLSTAHEGVSQAILQAGYLGKPLIATSVGGLGQVCLDRKTGIIVPPFSPESVAKAVLELMENPSLRNNMGLEARKLVETQFTLQHTLDEMERVYQQLS